MENKENKQKCIECFSTNLTSLAPQFPHIMECEDCGHPNDTPVEQKKVEETETNCEICKKRKATTTAIRMFEVNPIPVCDKCYNDLLDEENE